MNHESIERGADSGGAAHVAANDRCELGVLFVHGIGDQGEGETLTSFGEPLIEWMRDWIAGHGELSSPEKADAHNVRPDGVDVTYASLFPSRRYTPDPANARIDVRITPQGDPPQQLRQRWLFAESWWGEQVQPPGVFDLLGWLFSRGVWVLLAHVAEQAWQFTHPRYAGTGRWTERVLRKLDVTRWRHLAWLSAAGAFLQLAALLQLLLLIAAVLALIPVPAVRRFIAVVLQHATLILGDSYGLVANETQRGAILTRFQSTVDWLQARCDRLAIVAHSQGTAVVHAAVQGAFIKRPALLITFGSGLAKLAQLRRCELHNSAHLAAAAWIVPTALLTIYLIAWLNLNQDHRQDGLIIVAWALGFACLWCMVMASMAWYGTRVDSNASQRPLAGQPGRWIDLYASSDPVPQGDLREYLPACDMTSECIVNRRSLLADHGSYWKNKPEFVTRVAAELDREAAILGIPDLQANKEYELAVRHHHRAIRALSMAWWVMCISLFAIAATHFSYLAEMGRAFVKALENGPLSTLANYLEAPGQLVEWLTMQLTGSVPQIYSELGYWGIVIAGGLLLAYLWWTVIAALLIKWDSAQLADFVGHTRVKLWGAYGTWMVWPFVIVFTVVPPLSVWHAIDNDESVFFLPLKAMALLLVAEFVFFQLVAVLGAIVGALKNLRTLSGHAWAVLYLACTPGSDSATGQEPWWSRWKAMVIAIVGAFGVAGLVIWGLDELDVAPAFSSHVVSLPFVLGAVLLVIRLARLAAGRGYDARVMATAIGAPLILLFAYFYQLELAGVESMLFVASMIAIAAAGLAYAAVDRWLPLRHAGDVVET